MPKLRHPATKQKRNRTPASEPPIPALDSAATAPLFEWTITLDGLVDKPTIFPLEQFNALPQVTELNDFPEITPLSRYDYQWTGVAFTTLCDLVQPKPEAKFVSFTSTDGCSTNVPLARCLGDDVLVATQFAGEPIARDHGGPIRVIIPTLYACKAARAVKCITFLAEDRSGNCVELDCRGKHRE
jgi:DMSO/TMAO reductase YedYZ molybdopterin-dependent catalytic subunit